LNFSRNRVYSVLPAAMASLALLAGGLAGCSGGGGTTSMTPPTTVAQPPAAIGTASDDRILGTLNLDRAQATAVAGLVTSAKAHKLPLVNERGDTSSKRTIQAFYDLNNHGGPVVTSFVQYNIYVNCAGTCWGSQQPSTFLTNYGASSMIHLVDQYIGSTSNSRYTYGGGYQVNYNTSGTLHDQDMYNIVYAVAKTTGTGYGKMYHVFFQQGVSQCSTDAGGCYAVSGGYCAYHSNVNFSDIGHTLYSFEGYQNISGCQVTGTSPNGVLVDSTASTLSHEETETITDPDLNAWWNSNTGYEIGDICGGNDGLVTLNGHQYNIQREYSNKYHGCTFSP
jgi:hypothetical protein